MKACNKCKEQKMEFLFSLRKRSFRGDDSNVRVAVCKKCISKSKKQWYKKNKARILINRAEKDKSGRVYTQTTEKQKNKVRSLKRKQSRELSTVYVANLLAARFKTGVKSIPESLIRVERMRIKIKRELNGL